jgi:hypothetical protein
MTQKALDIRKRLFLPCLLSALAFAVLTFGSVSQARAATSVRPGFPDSFVELYTSHYGAFVDTGGKGEGQTIGAFGLTINHIS